MSPVQDHYDPIVAELIRLVHDNGWEDEFKLGIATALEADLEAMADVRSLDDYYRHINKFLHWLPTENETGKRVYDEICLFYFVLDQISVVRYQNAIVPSSVDLTPLSKWIVKYADCLGRFYDTERSISPETVASFYASPAYKMKDYKVPEGGWRTFNEFFARHVKDGLRAPDAPGYNSVVVSPADSVFDNSWPVDEENNVFFVKGLPWNIRELLNNSKYADHFKGGTFMHAFLNTTDYHRQHAPVTGIVREAKVVKQSAYLEVVVQAATDEKGRQKNRLCMRRGFKRHGHKKAIEKGGSAPVEIDAPDHPGYQFLQSRGIVVIETKDVGWVAVLPIGMAQVSSVVLSKEVQNIGGVIKKGDEISHFQFGGSDVVMVFDGSVNVDFVTPVGRHNNAGVMIAKVVKKKHHQ